MMCAAVNAETNHESKNGEKGINSLQLSTEMKEKLKLKRGRNPFKLPANKNYAEILKEDKQQRKTKFKKMLTSPVHLKVPIRHLSATNILQTIPSIPELEEKPLSPTSEITNDPAFVQAVAKGENLRNMEELTSFISNKREMFLIRYIIGVKHDEISRLVRKEHAEGGRLTQCEKWLEEDAVKFSEFLRLNDREAVDAVKQAEMETKMKLEKVAEIKKINVLIVNYKSKISKLEDILQEYKTYARFLNSVAPQEWQQQKMLEKQRAQEMKTRFSSETSKERMVKNVKSSVSIERWKRLYNSTSTTSGLIMAPIHHSRKTSIMRKGREKSPNTYVKSEPETEEQYPVFPNALMLQDMMAGLQLSNELMQYLVEDDEDDKVELYFTEPKQLPTIFAELLEQNLGLIQKCQESEESLEEVNETFSRIQAKMRKETKILRRQVAELENLVDMELRKANDFEMMSKIFSFGKYDDEDHELNELSKKVELVFSIILGPNDANLNALLMMTGVEQRLAELLDALDVLPESQIMEAMKRRHRQRRLDLHKAKQKELEEYLRQRRARTVSKATEKRSTFVGRKLMRRSLPPTTQQTPLKYKLVRSEEELTYFFT